MEIAGGAYGAGGFTSQLTHDFDRHEPVETATGVKDRSQKGQGVTQVVDDQIPICVDYQSAASSQRCELVESRSLGCVYSRSNEAIKIPN